MTLKQMLYGPLAGIILLFGIYTIKEVYETHNQVREIPVLIGRVEKLERAVTTLAESQVKANSSQKEIVGITEELQATIFMLTRIVGKTVGVEQDDNQTRP
ncbi:hypothetical protein PS914_03208 [Pseudomonas fluorescens]|uniref:hypothetical protein n=1 Tax=Pseudomonas fluorescens TaxID=294 RepID=UPI001241E4F7|nr:hypothetical protein [Pseudomonas fluorescens]VVP91895.1 hypothetical protein PS914_03208 [Pseudomonas fluorescens]